MMQTGKREALILLIGDILIFLVSLWLTLFFRYYNSSDAPGFLLHLRAFSALFFFWILVFYIAGLYDKHTNAFKRKLPGAILNAEIVNCLVSVLYFYFVPFFGITPKINLFIYLLITIPFITVWRLFLVNRMYIRRVENVLLVGNSLEAAEIEEEISTNKKYGLSIFKKVDSLSEKELGEVPKTVSTIILDLTKGSEMGTPTIGLSQLIFAGVRFIDLNDLYEDIFDRVVLSNLGDMWFLKNISSNRKYLYDIFKRVMDIVISLLVGVITLPLYPFVYFAIKFEDGGPAFIVQDRIGQGNRIMRIIKFRSMKDNDSGRWLENKDSRITKVGKFIRKTRIDELPQLYNVLRGDLSLIGPRTDIADLGYKLRAEIPYYTMRNLIKPGLSGWAQIHQDLPPQSIPETKTRLTYDFYYLKNRSLVLDLLIALRTLKTLLSRVGL